jgi:ABC-type phosphate/phosphonate transport system permease subunit
MRAFQCDEVATPTIMALVMVIAIEQPSVGIRRRLRGSFTLPDRRA